MVSKIGIIIGSTRPGRNGEAVARWIHALAQDHGGAQFEIIDLKHFDLPVYDEPRSPMFAQYEHEHTRRWSAAVAPFDGYIFVTPEYNHSTSAALKNALDYLHFEWKDKAAAFVGYGGAGGARAVEHLRGIVGELHMADVRGQIALSIVEDFENYSVFKPRDVHLPAVTAMLDQLTDWAGALKGLRERQLQRDAA